MEDQYGMADLRQYMNGRSIFPAIPPPQDILSSHRSLTAAQHYEMVMVGRQGSEMVHQGLHQDQFHSDHSTTSAATNTTSVIIGGTSSGGFSGGLEMDIASGLAGDGGTGRWPRQETLTLLEIRSRLDSKFKEANQKGPLWDEVSRIMSDEHGYHRSGKKCREKFENLYKYYKKTKEGKAGRQDGKHYRFFRQLEALYGETSNAASAAEHHLVGSSFRYNAANSNAAAPNNPEPFQSSKPSDSLSLSISSDFDATSSDDSDVNVGIENGSIGKRKKRSKRSWKAKIKDFIDAQMRKLMDKQEAWLEKMMKTIEHKEFERMLREEEWRKQEEARIDKEHKFWAKERAWIEARDTALVEALQKLTGKEFNLLNSDEDHVLAAEIRNMNEKQNDNRSETITNTVQGDHHSWEESEITRLIQLRTSMEPRFQQVGCSEILWKEIAAKMASFGYDRSLIMCQHKWDSINDYLIKCRKKGKENSTSCCYFQGNESICHQVGAYCDHTNEQASDSRRALDDHRASPPNCSTGQNINDGCYRYLMATDAENFWDNYGVKLCKGENN